MWKKWKPGCEFLNGYFLPEILVFNVERMSLSSLSKPSSSHLFYILAIWLNVRDFFLYILDISHEHISSQFFPCFHQLVGECNHWIMNPSMQSFSFCANWLECEHPPVHLSMWPLFVQQEDPWSCERIKILFHFDKQEDGPWLSLQHIEM